MPRLNSDDSRHVLSVSELSQQLRATLQSQFRSVWVKGEIGDLARPRSGHIYLTLKDESAQLRAVIWRNTAASLPFEIKDGMEVISEGAIDLYPPRGSYQIILRQIEPAGVGALQLAFQQLKEKLSNEGLFASERKQSLPRFPKRVVVITSPTGAAVRDFMEVVRRRWSETRFAVLPTRVQGAEAAPEIAAALASANRLNPAPDLVVLTRGGGSLEDLWCFNDERVVRAVANSRLPVVSAIGHEIDVTLTDLAADLRALTPSEAAERIVPSRDEMRSILSRASQQLVRSLKQNVELARTRVDGLAQRPVLSRPQQRIDDHYRRVDEFEVRLNHAIGEELKRNRKQLEMQSRQLAALSPLAVLARGYSVTQHAADQQLVRSIDQVQRGDTIETRVHDGKIVSEVCSFAATDDPSQAIQQKHVYDE